MWTFIFQEKTDAFEMIKHLMQQESLNATYKGWFRKPCIWTLKFLIVVLMISIYWSKWSFLNVKGSS